MGRLKITVLASLLLLSGITLVRGQSHNADEPSALAARIERIDNGFAPISLGANEPPVKLNVQKLLEISNVPGLSVAVFNNYKLEWAKGYGVTEAGGNTPVTIHTLFSAASVSKPVSALAALQLVEQGKLSLDEDVNLKLKSWKVPENEYTKEQKVTLRRILTHTAGTTVHGLIGYSPGQPIPTLSQIFNGEEPANNDPIRVDFVPGTKQRYSGGGVLIMQQLMIDVTGKSFPRIMQETVLDKLGLKDSTFEQPLPPSRASVAASGHYRNGETVPGKRNISPEMAVGGFWTSPSDLGRIAMEVALSKQDKSNKILSTAMTWEMLRLQVDPKIENLDGNSDMHMGLGWYLGGESDPGRFGHTGNNLGFLAEVIMWDSGHGVVIMSNNWSFNSQLVMRYVINSISKEYGWGYKYSPPTPWPMADTVVLAAARLRGPQAAIAKYFELKKLSAEQKGKANPTVVWATNPPDYPPSEFSLLGIAQTIADKSHLKDAIEIMKVEVQEYPKWANGYYFLGDLYERSGDKVLAIQTYEAVLKFAPDDANAIESLKSLKEKH